MTVDTFYHPPFPTDTQQETSEGQNNSDVLAETLKGFTIDSTINDSAYYKTDKNDAEGDPKNDQLVATHISYGKKRKFIYTDTTKENSPQKLLIYRTILITIPLIDLHIPDMIVVGRGTTHTLQTSTSKVIVMDAARIGTRIFWTHGDVSRTNRESTIPRDRKLP